MNNIKYLNDFIDEADRGIAEYTPSFMQIRLHKPISDNLADLNDQDLGILLHEYIHFLQNVSTPWGLYESMVHYNVLSETYTHIQQTTLPIELPLKIEYSEGLNSKINILQNGIGDCPLNINLPTYKIDRNKHINWHRETENNKRHKTTTITIDVALADSKIINIKLGSNIIKESMAAMYQNLIDKTATHEKADLPYNLVEILAEQHYPNIAKAKIKLITICYISLFSLSPAELLITELEYANEHPEMSAKALFELFINETKIHMKGVQYEVCEFFDIIIDTFKDVFTRCLDADIDYLNELLAKVRPAEGKIPILSIITDEQPLTREKIDILINFLGMPYTFTYEGILSLPPKSTSKQNKLASDMIALIGHNVLFTYLTQLHKYGYTCPMHNICEKEENTKEECFDEPWKGMECPMTIMGNKLKLSEKHFKKSKPF